MPELSPHERIILALDHHNPLEALSLADQLSGHVDFFKIGLGMLTQGGFATASELINRGKRVFLDMKFFDIGATVEKAVRGHMDLGVDFLTVHGDPYVVEAAIKGRGMAKTQILAVTVLTSLDRHDLDRALYRSGNLEDIVVERARLAFDAGADGVIASAHEAALIRALPQAKSKRIVVPGIRPQGEIMDDQKRIATPKSALESGADYLVIGRPIWAAPSPLDAAKKIIQDITS